MSIVRTPPTRLSKMALDVVLILVRCRVVEKYEKTVRTDAVRIIPRIAERTSSLAQLLWILLRTSSIAIGVCPVTLADGRPRSISATINDPIIVKPTKIVR
jgi:hypothetical protein